MSYVITSILKTCSFALLVVLVVVLFSGATTSSFAETTIDTDIVMTIDRIDSFGDEAEKFNNFLNVFTAAFLASGGNLHIVAINSHTICISVPSDDSRIHNKESCLNAETRSQFQHMMKEME